MPSSEVRWPLTQGTPTVANAKAWRLNDKIFGINRSLWGLAQFASRVRLTVWVDDSTPEFHVFEMRRDDNRPLRIPLNRKGKAIRFRLEGRGHLALKGLTLVGGQ